MKATLMPLDGKYYGTKIQIEDGRHCVVLERVWLENAKPEPSDRELEGICTIAQYRANDDLDAKAIGVVDEWPDGKIPAKEACEICDCHFESRETLALAQKIVDAVNQYRGKG